MREPGIVGDVLSEELYKLASNLMRCAIPLASDEQRIEMTSAADRCGVFAESVRYWLKQELGGQVYWIETRGERQNRVVLSSAPIDVGPVLESHLYSKCPTVIMTSATLSSGGKNGFKHAQQRIGMA